MASGIQSRGLTIPVLRRRLAQVDTPAFRATLAQLCAAAAGKFINDGFNRSVDPYGEKWEPLKTRVGKPLLDTGRLRASFASQVISGGFRIDATASYAPYHQFGTQPTNRARRNRKAIKEMTSRSRGGIPARPMVPTPELGGLPIKWQRQFAREGRQLAKRVGEGGSP